MIQLKRFFCLCCAVFLLAGLTSCFRPHTELQPKPDQNFQTDETQNVSPSEKDLTLTVWSWQIPTTELAQDFANQIKRIEFDSVEFCVLWNEIEPWQGSFDWTYFDQIMQIFVQNGLKINVSLLLWPEQLAWKDTLSFQKTADGLTYTYEDRGAFLCLSDENNLRVLENTLREFSVHCNENFVSSMIGWHVRTNPFGEIGYSPIADLDYSDASMQAFYNYIAETYKNISYFGKCYDLDIQSRKDLEKYDPKQLVAACDYDWNRFKQQTLVNFTNRITQILKAANPNIPVTMQISGFSDTLAALCRGTFDPYLLSESLQADILCINPAPDASNHMIFDLLHATVAQKLAVELDGAWRGEDAYNAYIAQVKAAGQSEIHSIRTADWELEQLEKAKNFLQGYAPFFRNAQPKIEEDNSVAILWNTTDFVLKTIPQDQTAHLQKVYNTLSENGNKRVRFITDSMLLQNPSLLDSISTLYLGELSEIIYLQEDLAKLLAEHSCKLYVDNQENFNFMNQFKQPLSDAIQKSLNDKILIRK